MATVKINFGNELRRFRVNDGTTWADLQQIVRTLFDISIDAAIALKYTDADGDLITISSDIELTEAINDAQANGGPLRLNLSAPAVMTSPSLSTTISATAPPASGPPATSDFPVTFTAGIADTPPTDSSSKGKNPAQATTANAQQAQEPQPNLRVIHVKVTGDDSDVSTPSNADSDSISAAAATGGGEPSAEAQSATPIDPFEQVQHLFQQYFPRLISELAQNNDNKQQPEVADEPKYVHWGVECDHCHSTLVGRRYRCVDCDNFDLCGDCYTPDKPAQPNHDPSHSFKHIPHPLAYLPPSSVEFAQRFANIVPSLLNGLGQPPCHPRAGRCGAWVRRGPSGSRVPQYYQTTMNPAWMFV